jgi:hypothetical protein
MVIPCQALSIYENQSNELNINFIVPHGSIASTDSEVLTSLDILKNHLNLINETILANFTNYKQNDNSAIYYSHVGLAGIGLEMIRLYNDMFANQGFTSLRVPLLNLIRDFADQLLTHAIINSTQIHWTLSNETDYVSLTYDFGLLGLLHFFTEFTLIDLNAENLEVTEKIFNTVSTLMQENMSHVWWTVDLNAYYDFASWYQIGDMSGRNFNETVYTGQALGLSGLLLTLGRYHELPNLEIDTERVNQLANKTIAYLDDLTVANSNYSVIAVTQETPHIISNSIAFGVSGVVEAYSKFYKSSGNQDMLDRAENLTKWLGFEINGQRNYRYTTITNGSQERTDYELGLRLGITGNLRGIRAYNEIANDSIIYSWGNDLINRIRNFGPTIGDQRVFHERVRNNAQQDASTSLMFGSTGIALEIYRSADLFGRPGFKSTLFEVKNYLFTNVEEGIVTNPMISTMSYSAFNGFTGILTIINFPSDPLITVLDTSLNFDQVHIGQNKTMELYVTNSGDLPAIVSLSQPSTPFYLETNLTFVESGDTRHFNITFQSLAEVGFTDSIFVYQDNSQIATVSLSATGFDLPTIELITPDVNSTLSGQINFDFNIIDSSTLKPVQYVISEDEGSYSSTGLLNLVSGNLFRTTWDTTERVNGTYTVTIIAEDVFDRRTVETYQFEVINFITVPPRIFETNIFLYVVIGLIVVLAIVSIVLVKRMGM